MADVVIVMNIPRPELDQGEVMERFRELVELTRAEWVRMAQDELTATAGDYIGGITPIEYGDTWAQIKLLGWLPNAIEHGEPPFDTKPGLLDGPHAKMGKNGPYNTVPFRHGTPGTTGKSVGAPMPFTGVTKKGNPVSAVYNAAKKLAPSVETASGKTKWGEKTGDFGGLGKRSRLGFWVSLNSRSGASAWVDPYTWKHSPYEGIYKIRKHYEKATQSQYISFRRVSGKSDPSSWWHPGIAARNFTERLKSFVNDMIERIF